MASQTPEDSAAGEAEAPPEAGQETPPATPPAAPAGTGETPLAQATVYRPAAQEGAPPAHAEASAPDEAKPAATVYQPAAQRPRSALQPGAILNGIYRVIEPLGAGGMGAVWRGVNLNDEDEKVAIKVTLAHLAEDEATERLFRNEAKLLTRVSHPAVVQYRLIAEDQALGVLYMVVELIEGPPLSQVLGKPIPSPAQLRALLKRLAEGLRAAHEVNVVHRDLSPDNVMLPDGRLDRAKIIDFGIGKNLDPKKGATVIGDGFAGKLAYVAPEQFGDFDRQIGPWTDVYSLGLVILAAARGQESDMGATLVEAMDKRRAGPDLSAIPEELRPTLAGMLTADPSMRLRSMDQVLASLEGAPLPSEPEPQPQPQPQTLAASRARLPNWAPWAGGGAVLALAAGAAVLWLATPKPKAPSTTASAPTSPLSRASALPTPSKPASPAELATLSAPILAAAPCAWLTLSLPPAGSNAAPVVEGTAQDRDALVVALAVATGGPGRLDLTPVARTPPMACAPLEALRTFATPANGAAQRLSIDSMKAGNLSVLLDIGDPGQALAVVGLDANGELSTVIPDRALLQREAGGDTIQRGATPDSWRVLFRNNAAGWQAIILITAPGDHVDTSLLNTPPARRDAEWADRVRAAGRSQSWRTDLVLFPSSPR